MSTTNLEVTIRGRFPLAGLFVDALLLPSVVGDPFLLLCGLDGPRGFVHDAHFFRLEEQSLDGSVHVSANIRLAASLAGIMVGQAHAVVHRIPLDGRHLAVDRALVRDRTLNAREWDSLKALASTEAGHAEEETEVVAYTLLETKHLESNQAHENGRTSWQEVVADVGADEGVEEHLQCHLSTNAQIDEAMEGESQVATNVGRGAANLEEVPLRGEIVENKTDKGDHV
mmetsp:Transcript_15794/g.46086  ORF Transcript_15794/g.46086 Transcript_15794/m.46086 type:complete len:228 (-) Transcript_15794:158-841(-)